MLSHELPLPYTIVALDVQGYGDLPRTDFHRTAVHNGLNRAVRRAFESASVRWDSCDWQDGGDGALILVPSSTSKIVVLDQVVRHLTDEVREHNEASSHEARIRLRLCLHAGDVRRTDYGVVGNGIILVNRLLNSAEVRKERNDSAEPLILAVTDAFFHEVVKHHPAANPETYRKVRVAVKETDVDAWVRITSPSGRPTPPTGSTPAPDHLTALVDALLEVPTVEDEVSRRAMLDQLPRRIGTAVRYHPRARLHVFEIVRTCRDYEHGIDALFTTLRKIEGDSVPVRRAEEAARKWMPPEGWAG